MTESQLRQKIVGIMQDWIGLKEADNSHMKIVNIYNNHTPVARGYKLSKTDAWCAATVSAAAITANLTDIIPTECSCTRMIELLKKLGSFIENDAYVPSPGDLIFYDWQDSGKGDNTGAPDHVGIVEKVSGSTITVIEGNYANRVGRRYITINARYIRGFGTPNYASKADNIPDNIPVKSGELSVGDIVQFIGTKQYFNSFDNAPSVSAKPCRATVTIIRVGRRYPYHLQGPGVDGWVSAADVRVTHKAAEEIAREVLDGKWGNNPDRASRLSAAGYDPAEVQRRVNALIRGS